MESDSQVSIGAGTGFHYDATGKGRGIGCVTGQFPTGFRWPIVERSLRSPPVGEQTKHQPT